MASLSNRLERLEQRVQPADAARRRARDRAHVLDQGSKWFAALDLLAPSMDAAHVAHVNEKLPDIIRVARWAPHEWLTLIFSPVGLHDDSLFKHIDWMIRRTGILRDERYHGPFVLPGEVAEIYVGDPYAEPRDECLNPECGYLLPRHGSLRYVEIKPKVWNYTMEGKPYGYFERCPLCSSPVETNRVNWTRTRIGAPFSVPPDLIEQVRRTLEPVVESLLAQVDELNRQYPPEPLA